MRRALLTICCAVAAGTFASASSTAVGATHAQAVSAIHPRTGAAAKRHAPADLLIDAQEWSLWPSRTRVPAGKIYVELWNRGQDAHDTWVRRLNSRGQMVGGVLARVEVTLPGHISQTTWHLKAGHYELFCSMPGHLAMGMHTKLTVTRN